MSVAPLKRHSLVSFFHPTLRDTISNRRLCPFFFVRDRIRYARDPVDVELVQDAQRTLEIASGDCDDKVTLLCSLLASAGYTTRFICGGHNDAEMEHVWCEVYLDWRDEWLPLDPTSETAAPGWSADFDYRLEWEIW